MTKKCSHRKRSRQVAAEVPESQLQRMCRSAHSALGRVTPHQIAARVDQMYGEVSSVILAGFEEWEDVDLALFAISFNGVPEGMDEVGLKLVFHSFWQYASFCVVNHLSRKRAMLNAGVWWGNVGHPCYPGVDSEPGPRSEK